VLLPHRYKLPAALLAIGLLFLPASAVAGPPPGPQPTTKDQGKLIVHEWGTFLTVQGSDGVTLGGMIDSEEVLPAFVRERALSGRNRACLFCKMETPVTYFYVDQPRTVQVRVGMPRGQLTHWFPAVMAFDPPGCKRSQAVVGSFLDWGQVELIPDTSSTPVGPPAPVLPGLRPVDRENTWRFARQTDAAFVRIADRPRPAPVRPGGEMEKFLFYRGLGTFELPLEVRSFEGRCSVNLTLKNRSHEALNGLFAVRVERDNIQFAALNDLAGDASQPVNTTSILSSPLPLKDGVPQIKQAVSAALVKAGLYPKEAQAMVNTWEKSYFRTEGLRLLYILPRSQVDEIIPLQIQPAPQDLVRVMIGRVEVLTPSTENRIEKAVADLGSRDPAIAKAAHAELARLGRFQEPVLHRIAVRTRAPEVRAQAEALIKAVAVKQ
jgi:hypothetical protein